MRREKKKEERNLFSNIENGQLEYNKLKRKDKQIECDGESKCKY